MTLRIPAVLDAYARVLAWGGLLLARGGAVPRMQDIPRRRVTGRTAR